MKIWFPWINPHIYVCMYVDLSIKTKKRKEKEKKKRFIEEKRGNRSPAFHCYSPSFHQAC